VVGLKAWGDQVLEDLWSDLEQETRAFALQPIPTWQEQERWVLEQFVENRGRGFIGRTEITRSCCRRPSRRGRTAPLGASA
jgi:hypothetical protein